MRYSVLAVAATAFTSAVAQNLTLPTGIKECCDIQPNEVPSDVRTDWCRAERNTCRSACDGAAGSGNTCSESTLEFECKCNNGTEIKMERFQQSVPTLMCEFWFGRCINATNEDLDLQDACKSVQKEKCGTEKIGDSTTSSSSSGPTDAPSGTSNNGGASNTAGEAAPATSSPGAAMVFAQNYGTPLMAGGIMAAFGLAM